MFTHQYFSKLSIHFAKKCIQNPVKYLAKSFLLDIWLGSEEASELLSKDFSDGCLYRLNNLYNDTTATEFH